MTTTLPTDDPSYLKQARQRRRGRATSVGVAAVLVAAVVAGPAGAATTATPAAPVPAATASRAAVAGLAQANAPTAVHRPGPAAAYTFMMERVSHDPTQRPRVFQLELGRTNTYLERMTWTRWGTRAARARGYLTIETSRGGRATIKSYRVRVTAHRLVHKEATQVYSRLRVTFTHRTPPRTPRTVTYYLPR